VTDSDLTLAVLREIRDEIKSTRTELKGEIAQTNDRLGVMHTELKAEIVQTNERLGVVETTLQDLAAQLVMLTRYVGNVVDRHEQAIGDLRERVVRLETRGEQG
jgi:chromosome segregation ATPase